MFTKYSAFKIAMPYNCVRIMLYRKLISLFSVLGEEVALYCSKYLPDIIKEQKAYKDGKLQKVDMFSHTQKLH